MDDDTTALTERTVSKLAAVLREAAELVESLDIDVHKGLISGSISLHGLSKDELATFARQLGHVEKHAGGGNSFWLAHTVGLGIQLVAFARSRDDVCRRVVVGTEDVPEQTIPAHTREIVEWECEPLLASRETSGEEATV